MPGMINYRKELDDIQYNAVTAESRFIRVIAGAGSGKTRVLTHRYAYLIQKKRVHPQDILCVTFTNRATEEMQRRIITMLGSQEYNIMTFNSLGNRILHKEIRRIGWAEDYKICADESEQIRVIKKILDTYENEIKELSLDDIADYITEQKKKLGYLEYMTIGEETDLEEQIQKAQTDANIFLFIYYSYLKMQVEDRFTDFTDQICLPLMMFDKFPDMKKTWSAKYRYILVDEFQDVSKENYKLCEILTGEQNDLFVVGDPDQMIYSWRDASPDCLINFEKTHLPIQCFEMMTNYRSNKEIVAAANRLIAYNTSHDPNNEMIPDQKEDVPKIQYYHSPPEKKEPYQSSANENCDDDYEAIDDDEVDEDERTDSAIPDEEHSESDITENRDYDKNEAEMVVRNIKKLLDEGVKGNSISVLYRNHVCAHSIKVLLNDEGIPFKEYKEDKPYLMPLIKKTIALMRVTASRTNEAFDSFMSEFENDIEEAVLFDVVQRKEAKPRIAIFKDIITKNPKSFPAGERLLNVISNAKSLEKEGNCTLSEVVEFLIQESGIQEEADKYQIIEEKDNLDEFRDQLKTIQEKMGEKTSLSDCLQFLDEKADRDEEKCVQLSTIHTAKGLEFDYVFIIGMTDSIIPNMKSTQTVYELEEERRLAYVACTRAQKQLWISENSGTMDDEYPSPFIFDAGNGVDELEQIGKPLSSAFIADAVKRFQKRVWWMKYKEKIELEEKLPAYTEVEHMLYGHGTVTGVRNGVLIVKFDEIGPELMIYDTTKLQIVPNEELEKEIPEDELLKEIWGQKEAVTEQQQRIRDVLDIIDRAADNEEHRDKVSVIGLPCGAGKSSALSLKICRVIAAYEQGSKEGILIISPTKDQLYRYLYPADPVVRRYIKDHMHQIVRMDGDNKAAVFKRIGKVPVLIITNNRYFRLDYTALKNKYLTFNKGCKRTLIVMDEEPEVCQVREISAVELNDIDSAIKVAFDDSSDPEEKEVAIGFWDKWRGYLNKLLKQCETKAMESGNSEYYSFESQLYPYREPDWPKNYQSEYFYNITAKYKNRLNNALRDRKDKPAIIDLIWTLYSAMKRGGVYCFRKSEERTYSNSFHILSYNSIYFDDSLDAKIVILDGTARLSPYYKASEKFHVEEVDERFTQPLPNLTLWIINQATGKTKLRADEAYRNIVIKRVREYFDSVQAETQKAIFTNLDLEPALKNAFPDAKVEHFGNLRGKNEFRDYSCIFQVGLNRFPETMYFLLELFSNPALYQELRDLESRGESTNEIISKRINDTSGKTKEIMDCMLFCDIEQNLFRGALRKYDGTPYAYYLFMSKKEYRNLIRTIIGEYRKLQAQVKIDIGNPTFEDKFLEWHDTLEEGKTYTLTDIGKVFKLKPSMRPRDWYKHYPLIREILEKDRVKPGVYIKGGKK